MEKEKKKPRKISKKHDFGLHARAFFPVREHRHTYSPPPGPGVVVGGGIDACRGNGVLAEPREKSIS